MGSKTKIAIPTEAQEQERIFTWATMHEMSYPELELLNGSLNGVRLTIGQSVKAKKAGMKRGYPDINLPVARNGFHGLYIELKRTKGGILSPEQNTWISRLNEQGYKAVVCKGADESINEIMEYLNILDDEYYK